MSLHVSFKSQTLDNIRHENEISDIKKRNDYVESELVFMLEIKKEKDIAIGNKNQINVLV